MVLANTWVLALGPPPSHLLLNEFCRHQDGECRFGETRVSLLIKESSEGQLQCLRVSHVVSLGG